MNKIFVLIVAVIVFASCGEKEYKDKIYEKPEIVKEAPSDYLSPEEAIKKFYLPEGYKIELVASEPMVREPVAITKRFAVIIVWSSICMRFVSKNLA